MHYIAKIIIMMSLALLVGCEAEWRMGDAVDSHYDYETAALNIDADVACEYDRVVYLEDPTYCDQWPGMECCVWSDDTCETEWCRWHDTCDWEWQYTECY